MKQCLLFILSVIASTQLSAQILADTSFEASGAAGTPWSSTSANFGTSFCDNASCGNCGGPCVPNTGSWYVWFGGTTSAETGTAAQSFNASSAGAGTLTYYWKVPMKGDPSEGDSLIVLIDGVSKSRVGTYDSIGTYQLVTLNVGQITAGSHNLSFTFVKNASVAVTNVLVDDIQLRIAGSVGIEEIDFMNGIQISSSTESKNIIVKYNLNENQDIRLTATDLTGKAVYINTIDKQQTSQQTIETNGWAPGIYNVTLSTNKGLTKTSKVVVY